MGQWWADCPAKGETMTYALMGLTVLAASFMLRQRLGLDFSRRQFSTLTALAGFLLVIVLEGMLVYDSEKEIVVLILWSSAFGWMMLIAALIGACGAYRGEEAGPVDIAVEEYMAQREEKIRQKTRERLAERDREQE